MKLESIFTDRELLDEMLKWVRFRVIEKGDTLLSLGDDVVFTPLILKGVLRIIRVNEEGQEFFLYHIYAGQTCAMTINCCQTGKKSMKKAVAEDDTEVVLIPVEKVNAWLKFPEWKMFINGSYSYRFEELINLIDLIAFNNMDSQLLNYLQQRVKATGSAVLAVTHQQIANEMHAHREAISRLLRTMEQKGMVKLGRNTIELSKSYV